MEAFEGDETSFTPDDPTTNANEDTRNRNAEGVLTNVTILSGDLMSDDETQPVRPAADEDMTAYNTALAVYDATRDDNSYTVVRITGRNTTLNGLTITAGERGTARLLNTFVGAGLYASTGTTGVVVELCTFNNNRAGHEGGGAYFGSASTLTNCTFNQNSTNDFPFSRGGGAFFQSASTLTGCIFTNNATETGRGGGAYFDRIARLTTCNFTGNIADNNGGGAFFFGNAIVTSCAFTGNSARGTSSNGGGGYFSQVRSTLVNCVFDVNDASNDGGGAYFPRGGTVINTTFYKNKTGNQGGGIAVAYFGDETNSFNLRNSILISNTTADALSSNQIYVANRNPENVVNLQHNLISGGAEGIMYDDDASANLTEENSINHGHDATVVFASTDATDDNYLHLKELSPAIAAGNNDYLNNGTPVDLEDDITTDATGAMRIQAVTVDLGAYESMFVASTPQTITFTLATATVVTVGGTINLAATTDAPDRAMLPITFASSADVAVVVNNGDGTFSLRFDGEGTVVITASQVGGVGADGITYSAATASQTFMIRLPFIRRVTTTGDVGNDGSSWAKAMTLDAALTASVWGDQVWIAAGTYLPDVADRTATFSISAGVLVYGGFEGTDLAIDDDGFDPAGGTDARARETDGTFTNETILSGDIGTAGTRDDNSYTVVTLAGADVTLNGLTIEAGERGSPLGEINVGAGLFAGAGTAGAVVALCTFKDNNTTGDGGGAYFYETATVTSSIFTGNSSDSDGGGIYFDDEATLTSCTFAGNRSGDDGGGAVFREISTLVNCVFVNNSATDIGGGIYFPAAGTILNSTFYNNTSSDGDGIFVRFDTNNPFTLQNSILVDPTGDSESGNQLYVENTEDNNVVNINYNLIEDGTDIVVFENEPGSNVGITNTRRIDDGATLFMSTTVGDANFFRLADNTLALNAGNNDYVNNATPPITTDAAGEARIQGVMSSERVDLGAYESVFETFVLAPQTITFTLDDVGVVDVELALTGTINTGLEITYMSSNANVAEVGTGDQAGMLILRATGTATVTASQAGTADYYAAATAITQDIMVREPLTRRVTTTGDAGNDGLTWATAMTFTGSPCGFHSKRSGLDSTRHLQA